MKDDKEHKNSPEKYSQMLERMYKLPDESEKIMPKQWRREIKTLRAKYDSRGRQPPN